MRRGGKDETIWWRVTVWGEQFDKMMPYLKKGSAIIVFGELSKPEIFTDRNGQSQVSMNVTAINLSFSPFGRPDQASGEASAHQGSPAGHAQPEMAFAAEPAMHGQGKADHSFSDDEIPF